MMDLEDDLGDGTAAVSDRLFCLVSDMKELASVEAMDDEEELAPSLVDEFLPIESKEGRAPFIFFLSTAVGLEEIEVCERRKVATLCGIL